MTGESRPSSILRPLADDLRERRAVARLGGGRERIDRQHAADKLTARERIDLLVDVIDPRETRPTIIRGLEMAEGKRVQRPWKRHGVMPV